MKKLIYLFFFALYCTITLHAESFVVATYNLRNANT